MYAPLFNNVFEFRPCECCRPRYSTFTATTGHRKWTKKEIEKEILYLSKELVDSKWYNRGDIRRRLKHWIDKYNRYVKAKEEFN